MLEKCYKLAHAKANFYLWRNLVYFSFLFSFPVSVHGEIHQNKMS